jgi:hypothetical protein
MISQAATINNQAVTIALPQKTRTQAAEKATDNGQAVEAPPRDQYEQKQEITIPQAFKAVGSAITGGIITSVGATGSMLYNLPRATVEAGKTIWKTDMIGPVLKTTLTALLPVAVAAAPALSLIAGIGVGMFVGFDEVVEHDSFSEATKKSLKNVKEFHTDMAPRAIDEMAEWQTPHLQPGEKPFDLKPLTAVKGIAGAVAGATIEGAGMGFSTLVHTPGGFVRAYHELIKSDDIDPVLKTTAGLLIPPAAVLASPLVAIGGTVYGTYKGFADTYNEDKGFNENISERLNDVKQWNRFLTKAIYTNDYLH